MAQAKAKPKAKKAKAKPVTIGDLESFIREEVTMLDDRRFEEWAELFGKDGYYWAPARPDQESFIDEVSIFYDDRELMNTRIQRLRHPRIHSQIPHSRTCHLVTNVKLEKEDKRKGEFTVSSRFLMLEYRENEQRVFAGRYTHNLKRKNGSFIINSKKADLVNCDAVFAPMAIPF